jgi:dTDP-glucose 4,6-dehydratase
LRYAIDANKINKELGWHGAVWARVGTDNKNWYLENQTWIILHGDMLHYYETI